MQFQGLIHICFTRMRLAAKIATSLIFLSNAVSAQATAPFTISDITADHTVSQLKLVPFFRADRNALLAKGRTKSGEKVFSFYEMDSGSRVMGAPTLTVHMPPNALFYDFAPIGDQKQETLLFLGDEGVQRYDLASDTMEPLVALSSIYRQGSNPLFEQLDFARDLNGDGYADIIVPDFGGYRLRLNDGKGGFGTEVLLEMQVEMRLSQQRPLYSQFPLYTIDMNFDGKLDIAFLKDRSFVAFLQNGDGGFDAVPSVSPIDMDVIGNSFAEFIKSEERYQDQANLAETRIRRVEDINGDGIVDIVTVTDRAQGIFKRSSMYQFHYGQQEGSKLVFRSKPNTRIALQGITAENRLVDFADDGRMDFVGGAVNIGIGKIIGILLSGSVSIHINFFEQGADGRYAAKPNFRKKVSVDFDMSSGQSSVPVTELADIDGDKAKDMILSDGTKMLRLFKATPGAKKMFARKSIDVKVELPKNGELVRTADLNGDGKGDLLIHFDKLGSDGQANKNRFIVLVAN
ncbi:MAG: VCBS repeat-containing protein [Kordiimonadaceae bacterium]|nr:VCBS repeat-containing protein [Kordiimonadaceae bacterium]